MNEKDFFVWHNKKKSIHETDIEPPYFKEREVWWVSLGVNVGVEIDGKHELFSRPVIVIRKFNKHMALVIPITNKGKSNKYYFDVSAEDERKYTACLSQIRTISSKRFFRKINTTRELDYVLLADKVAQMIKGTL